MYGPGKPPPRKFFANMIAQEYAGNFGETIRRRTDDNLCTDYYIIEVLDMAITRIPVAATGRVPSRTPSWRCITRRTYRISGRDDGAGRGKPWLSPAPSQTKKSCSKQNT